MAQYKKEDIKGYECKHGIYRECGNNDMVLVKERVHLKDGTSVPSLRMYNNYQRDFWVSKPGFRKYEQKKTTESLDRVQRFSTNQALLPTNIAKALGRAGYKGSLRQICKSPYVYGADVTTPVIIKQKYKTKYPDCISLNTVAVLDIETDVVKGTGDILMIALTYQDRAVLCVTREYLGTTPTPKETFFKKLEEYLGDYIKARNCNVELIICDKPGEAVAKCMVYAHKWMPDFISIWNMNFDLPRMVSALQKEGYDIGHVFSDPCVPREYRTAEYVEAPPQKVTASGKVTAPHPADLWHTMDCIASFYFIDSMCLYKKVRSAAGNEPSYALDALLKKHLNLTKLKFDAVKHAEGTLTWHEIMQAQYKIEYMVYNIFDCIAVEMFDEKVTDISTTISILNGSSEYARFPSQPRRTCDGFHFYLLEHENSVIATTSSDMIEDLDQDVTSMNEWIVTLPTHQVEDNGLCVIREMPNIRSNIRVETNDLDCTSSYPNGQIALNISRETTYRELSKVRGLEEQEWRKFGINLSGGHNNAMELCGVGFNYPDPRKLLAGFRAELALEQKKEVA